MATPMSGSMNGPMNGLVNSPQYNNVNTGSSVATLEQNYQIQGCPQDLL